MRSRREFLLTASATLAGYGLNGGLAWAGTDETFPGSAMREIQAVEKASGGRLGVAVLDTATGARANYRGAERFPMCSTFKVLAEGAVLAKVDAGAEHLDRLITFERKDVVAYSPITGSHAGGTGMPLRELCAAAITHSDNTAANMLLSVIGGPAGLTHFVRSLGDDVTRLDRIEPGLNEALPGDLRDTTTPTAMLNDVHSLVIGESLSVVSRGQLKQWLLGNKTGDERLRAGVPKGWRVGDKTGSGERGTTNDVEILWPPGHAPVIVSVYLTGSTASSNDRNATIAAVGRMIAKSYAA